MTCARGSRRMRGCAASPTSLPSRAISSSTPPADRRPVRVTAVRTVLLAAPWTGDPFCASQEPFERTAALVVVDTDEGVSGVGETIMGYFAAEVVSPIIDYYRGLLVRLGLDPRQPEAAVGYA